MPRRTLITGAAGFIGSHLCDKFIRESHQVMGMDNLITGDLKNIKYLFKHKNFEFYRHSVTTFVHVSGELDYILHFASPTDYPKISIQTLKVGSLERYNLLELVREINQLSKQPLALNFEPLPKNDPKQRRPDITRAKKLLNWQPKTNRKEGLKKNYEYFKQLLQTEHQNQAIYNS